MQHSSGSTPLDSKLWVSAAGVLQHTAVKASPCLTLSSSLRQMQLLFGQSPVLEARHVIGYSLSFRQGATVPSAAADCRVSQTLTCAASRCSQFATAMVCRSLVGCRCASVPHLNNVNGLHLHVSVTQMQCMYQ